MAPREFINGQWKALDWCDKDQMDAHLEGVKKAGVTVVIADLTNGWNWLDNRCQAIQALCAKKGLKFCVAENSTGRYRQIREPREGYLEQVRRARRPLS